MFGLFRREAAVEPQKRKRTRMFAGARNSQMVKFQTSYARINAELKSDYIALCLRARDLAKNNEVVAGYLALMTRNVLGATGFQLQCTATNDDGTSDTIANDIIETAWYDYTTSVKKYVSADETMNGLEFDRHILYNFLVDGEVFIHKFKDARSKYGVRFELIDSLDVDLMYNVQQGNERVCMGIKIDAHNKPLSYFVRKNHSTDYYLAGDRVEIPASEIIHIYRHNFVGQLRGYTPLAPVLLQLHSADTYKQSEINASILNSAYMGIWTETGNGDAYSQYDDAELDNDGNVALELESNVFRYAPKGYKLESIQPNHPNQNVGGFLKNVLKGIASALGISYNRLYTDYEATSYSSMRAAHIEDCATYQEIQQILIDGWKRKQYQEWLKCVLLSDLTNLPYSKIEKFSVIEFIGRKWASVDPIKDLQAIQMKLEMHLTDPISEIEALGQDPVDVLDRWVQWNKMLEERQLSAGDTPKIIEKAVEEEASVDEDAKDMEG